MSPRKARRSEALVLDPGVLREGPVCELGSSLAVEAQGGVAVQPWRDLFLADEAAGRAVQANARAIASVSFAQVIVHLQKSRAATFDDLAEAWRILAPGGELLFSGSNSLGVVSAVKRLSEDLDQQGVVVANRARARVVRFLKGSEQKGGEQKDGERAPEREATEPIEVELPGIGAGGHFELATVPGVFSARRIDPGSELLIEAFARIAREKPPRRIVDLGCGTGVLGIVAARLFPAAEVLLVDADARAVECAATNIARLGLADRARVLWWDAREKPPENGFDWALVNPPFHHRGPEVDLVPALALFESLSGWLTRNGRALLVANRTLPYEAALGRLGVVEQVADERGYKVLSLSRSVRSKGSRGRKDPALRPDGRSRLPTRSR